MSSILFVYFFKDGHCVLSQSFNIDTDPEQEIYLDPPTDCDSIQISVQRLDVPPPSTTGNMEGENSQNPDKTPTSPQ